MLLKPKGTKAPRLIVSFWSQALSRRMSIALEFCLELITGGNPRSKTTSPNSGNETLNEWVAHLSASSNFYSIVDKSLMGQGFDQGKSFSFLELHWSVFSHLQIKGQQCFNCAKH
ncbi:hypothetical protein SLA2020_172010 [Shorea laevis]